MSSPLPRDELASAYLDGEATPDERAAVEGDAALLALVEEMRAVRRALAVPVPPRPAAEVDAAIAAALAATAPGETPPWAPIPLAPRKRHRARLGLAVLGAAAAAAALVAIAANRTDDRNSSSASRAVAAVAPTTTAASGGVAGTIAAAATTATAAPSAATTIDAAQATGSGADTAAGLPALGPVDDADGLRAALAAVPESGLSASTASAADGTCTVPGARLVATVAWQGTPALVFVDGANVAQLVSQSTCVSVGSVPLS